MKNPIDDVANAIVSGYLVERGLPDQMKEREVRTDLHCRVNDAIQRARYSTRGLPERIRIKDSVNKALYERGYRHDTFFDVYQRM